MPHLRSGCMSQVGDFATSHLAAIAMAVRLTVQGLAESFDVEICETAWVSDLKQRIWERLQKDRDQFRLKLMQDTAVLQDSETLKSYGRCVKMVS